MATPLKPEFVRSLRDAAEFIQSAQRENRVLSRSEKELWAGLASPEIVISLLDEIDQLKATQQQVKEAA